MLPHFVPASLPQIGVLSGGEKARAALAAFALVPCNVLLLDEASNHLDAATIKTLTGALQVWRGLAHVAHLWHLHLNFTHANVWHVHTCILHKAAWQCNG